MVVLRQIITPEQRDRADELRDERCAAAARERRARERERLEALTPAEREAERRERRRENATLAEMERRAEQRAAREAAADTSGLVAAYRAAARSAREVAMAADDPAIRAHYHQQADHLQARAEALAEARTAPAPPREHDVHRDPSDLATARRGTRDAPARDGDMGAWRRSGARHADVLRQRNPRVTRLPSARRSSRLIVSP